MKKTILATVLTLLMSSPVLGVGVHDQAATLLVASNEQPKKIIITGKGGKVTDVKKGDKEKKKPKKKK